MSAEVAGGQASMRTRNGADCTEWFPEVAAGLRAVREGPHVFDGEVVVLDDVGRSDFERLQDRAKRRRWHQGCDPVA
jgi:bifunctional non-homologous end joining protein LigD